MNDPAHLRIEPPTPSRREDYLRLFDHARRPALRDSPESASCYCHFHHVSPRLDWEALDGDANRVAMDARVACAEMEGYLAYRDAEVTGWLNAQPRNRLRHCDARIGVEPVAVPVPGHEAAAIVCFVVAAAERGRVSPARCCAARSSISRVGAFASSTPIRAMSTRAVRLAATIIAGRARCSSSTASPTSEAATRCA